MPPTGEKHRPLRYTEVPSNPVSVTNSHVGQESHIPSLSHSGPCVPIGDNFYLTGCSVEEMASAGHSVRAQEKPALPPAPQAPAPGHFLSAWSPGRGTEERLLYRGGRGEK